MKVVASFKSVWDRRLEWGGNPASVAAIHILDHLAKDGTRQRYTAITTVGDGTLLPITAQDSLRQARKPPGDSMNTNPRDSVLAASWQSYAYAGIATVLRQGKNQR
ncbi:MAG: hypothetical protein H6669_14935 [Ardenticatenaceae bacterium]|nr:hypothetical protein [Ardenticatenaceae bacterium]